MREMGASGMGLDGVGVVEREDGWGVELNELPPDEEPSSLISVNTTHSQRHLFSTRLSASTYFFFAHILAASI